MSMFKVGDKVVRKEWCGEDEYFISKMGGSPYYIVTSVSPSDIFLQVDGFVDYSDKYPWSTINFELYQEPEDEELPPAPVSVQYYNSTTDEDNFQHMLVQPHWELEGHLSIAIVKSGKKFDPMAYGDVLSLNLDPASAMQLASDLRRMAMEIKRKEKAQWK